MAVRIDTIKYQASHGQKPRQPYGMGAGRWAFQIDMDTTPVFIRGTYQEAVKQAKSQAQYSITVLP